MSDNPAEYVRKLENEVRCLRADVDRLARDRDEYRDQVQTLGERVTNMTSAAASAAATAFTAISRIQELDELTRMFIASWDSDFSEYYDELDALIVAEQARRGARS